MAVASAAADRNTELLQKLSLDSQTNSHNATDATKRILTYETSGDQNTGYIASAYQTFYYGGCNGSLNEWDEYNRFLNHDGIEMPHGIYGDIYHQGYGYSPYGPYPLSASPGPAMGHEGQLYGAQQYQYLGPFYQQSTSSSAPYASNHPSTSQGEISAMSQPMAALDSTKASSNTISIGNSSRNNTSASSRSRQGSSTHMPNYSYERGALSSSCSSGHQDSRFYCDSAGSPFMWFDGLSGGKHRLSTSRSFSSRAPPNSSTSMTNPNNCSSHLMGPGPTVGSATPAFINRMCSSNHIYGHYGSDLWTGVNVGSNIFDSRKNGQSGPMGGKHKPTARVSGLYCCDNENLYGFGELNRGPRGYVKNQAAVGPVTTAVKGENLASMGKADLGALFPGKELYNQEDFREEYSDAKFFIIKSYSEDDIHKSIKYSVWASTPSGNKKLDAAYQISQGDAGGCPVFLFFSVNASGQFVGLAEMRGPVDFNRTVDYWQQDKWTGCFPVKWHIVKDVPNSILKHIILEYNDNKPVTNSRDTQEVKLEQGLQMVKIFKKHESKTSILDDFMFYENRQKIILEKKAKQLQLSKQVLEGKVTTSTEKENQDISKADRRESVFSGLEERSSAVLGECKPLDKNGVPGEALKRAKGVANES